MHARRPDGKVIQFGGTSAQEGKHQHKKAAIGSTTIGLRSANGRYMCWTALDNLKNATHNAGMPAVPHGSFRLMIQAHKYCNGRYDWVIKMLQHKDTEEATFGSALLTPRTAIFEVDSEGRTGPHHSMTMIIQVFQNQKESRCCFFCNCRQ